jgi:hypothetical protein
MVRIAIGVGGAFMTINGMNWTRLLHTGALPGTSELLLRLDFRCHPSLYGTRRSGAEAAFAAGFVSKGRDVFRWD